MNLKAKVYVENQKRRVQEALNVRLARLKEKGVKEDVIQRDATVRKLKAQVRKADYRLGSIAAQEKLNRERVQAKLDKEAAEKAAKEAPQLEEEKGEPEKKEKKAKKEKQAKPEGKGEGKKEKKEKQEKPKKELEKEEGV